MSNANSPSVDSVCNAESSLVSRSAALAAILHVKAKYELVACACGLHAESETNQKKERFAIVQAKLHALDLALDAVSALPAVNTSLGKNLILRALVEAHDCAFREYSGLAAAWQDPVNPTATAEQVAAADGAVTFIRDFLAVHSVGSAEEQPTPDEESRPVALHGDVTQAGANPSNGFALTNLEIESLSKIPDSELLALSDQLLNEIDRRDLVCWGVTA